MAKRKSTEVILSGEKVSPQYKASPDLIETDRTPVSSPAKPAPSASQRIRERPSVRDVTPPAPAAVPSAPSVGGLADLEKELGMKPTAAAVNRTGAASPPASPPPASPPPASPRMAPAELPTRRPEARADKKNENRIVSPRDLSREKAAEAVTSMITQMTARAESNGGFLRTSEIVAMEAAFQTDVAKLALSLEASFQAFAEARDRAEWDIARNFPFGRVLVKKFSHLFRQPGSGRMDTVSKRMLPGFFAGLNMMIGVENVEQFQERSRRVVETIRQRDGTKFDWEQVYRAPEIEAVVIDALFAMSPHFADFERRQEWFVDLVNGQLGPVSERDSDAGWELTPAAYKRFLFALFADLHRLLNNPAAHVRMVKRYGADAVKAVINLRSRID